MLNATVMPSPSPQSILLQTYALVLRISVGSVADNLVTTSTLSAAPDLLYHTVQILRSGVSGPALLATLARGPDGVGTASLSSLTVNFTLRSGVDLHAARVAW
ncbi:hypothetical protein JKF63_07235 [Porcisia hertigi]|uniref:Uncharacterized protein n=1 Tax=Porcisia hertigi TaxID=2761500 RepID=A0A836YJ61_9TRYP|nr:hypothetical protein JKF63_07235 [Porcisia hertigi]